jgi:glutathione reductase (NADPH)
MVEQTVDVLVIGTGTAGYTLALACRKGGRQVAVVDNRPYGGSCGMRGCESEKYLVKIAEVAQLSHQMADIGISPPAGIDWGAMIRSKTSFMSEIPERTEKTFEEAGIKLLFGTARFVSSGRVAIDNDAMVSAQTIVIATGAKPAPLHFPGSDLVLSTEDFLNLPTLPRRILFIGGGCLAVSFGHAARAAGAAVTILQRGERILKQFDAEMVRRLTKSAEDLGIKIATGITASMAEELRGAFVTYGAAGCTESFASDLIVNTTGRVPDLDKLELERGEVSFSAQGVTVNEYLQSVSNPRVWAIGDACDTPYRLSTVAELEAEVAAENILKGKLRRPDYRIVPTVAFAHPPLAAVGMTEEQAASSGLRFRINRGAMQAWPSSRRIGQKNAFYKVLLQDNGNLLGAHLLGHNSSDTINIFAAAMNFGVTNQELLKVLWAYPTNVPDLKDMIS